MQHEAVCKTPGLCVKGYSLCRIGVILVFEYILALGLHDSWLDPNLDLDPLSTGPQLSLNHPSSVPHACPPTGLTTMSECAKTFRCMLQNNHTSITYDYGVFAALFHSIKP